MQLKFDLAIHITIIQMEWTQILFICCRFDLKSLQYGHNKELPPDGNLSPLVPLLISKLCPETEA
jgi:hypothetical protein